MNSKETNFIGYKLHKDKTPTIIKCDSKEKLKNEIIDLRNRGYKPTVFSTEKQADKFLAGESLFKINNNKKLTKEERWWDWALGIN